MYNIQFNSTNCANGINKNSGVYDEIYNGRLYKFLESRKHLKNLKIYLRHYLFRGSVSYFKFKNNWVAQHWNA